MDLVNVKKLLEEKKLIGSPANLSSIVWETFQKIKYVDGPMVKEWVQCKICFEIIKYAWKNAGTSNLQRHISYIHSESSPAKTSRKRKPENAYRKLNFDEKREITSASADFVSYDIHPIKAIQGVGLHQLVNTHAEIYSKSVAAGNVQKGDNILPSRSTLSNTLKSATSENDIVCAETLQEILLLRPGISLSVDVWSSKHGKKDYLGMIAHFIEKDATTISRILIAHYPLAATTAVDIQNATDDVLIRRLKLTEDIRKERICFITDQGSNVSAAFSSNFASRRHACACHAVHNIVEKILDPRNIVEIETNYRPKELLTICSAVVAFLRKSLHANSFNPKLVPYCSVRWGSVHRMMTNMLKSWEQLLETLLTSGKSNLMEDLERDELETFVKYLKPFISTIKQLESQTEPTIHLVIPAFLLLEKHVQFDKNIDVNNLDLNGRAVHESKKAIEKYFIKKFQIFENEINYYVAMYLHPKLRSLSGISDIKKRETKEEVNISN